MIRSYGWLVAGWSFLTVQVLWSQDGIKCTNNLTCFEQHIDVGGAFTFVKEEKEGDHVIEHTRLDFNPMPQPILDNGKMLQTAVQISVDAMSKQKVGAEYSLFKSITKTCPDLKDEANLALLVGKEAECVLNDDIIEYQQPEDIYWCQGGRCMMGKYAKSDKDERFILVKEGLLPWMKCSGKLWQEIRTICTNDFNTKYKE